MASITYTIVVIPAQSEAIDGFASIENNTCSPWGPGIIQNECQLSWE